jgi:hypothetical protein
MIDQISKLKDHVNVSIMKAVQESCWWIEGYNV